MKVQSIRSLVLILVMGVLGTLVQASAVRGQQAPAPVPTVGESFMAHDYTRTHSFPNIFDSFTSLSVPQPSMQNSPRLKDLIRDGKLWLSLQDAIALALENNLDIDYVRFQYTLRADGLPAHQGGLGGPRRARRNDLDGAVFRAPLARPRAAEEVARAAVRAAQAIPAVARLIWVLSAAATPLSFLCGLEPGRHAPRNDRPHRPVLCKHALYRLFGFLRPRLYDRHQHCGGVFGDRTTTSALTALVNPEVPTFMGITLSQNLLNGFGYRANAANLRIAKNDLKFADSVFRQNVMTTLQTVVNRLLGPPLLPREHPGGRGSGQVGGDGSEKDNTRQVEIGTMAAIEVTRAKSEVATRKQGLILPKPRISSRKRN